MGRRVQYPVGDDGRKPCSKCGALLTLDKFNKSMHRGGAKYYRADCRDCQNLQRLPAKRARFRKHYKGAFRRAERLRKKLWYAANRDALKRRRLEKHLYGAVEIERKRCTKCGEKFPPTRRYFCENGRGALRAACKKCQHRSYKVWRDTLRAAARVGQ